MRGKLLLLLRRIEEFRSPAFVARRLHLSRTELLAQLSAHEAAIGAPLVEHGETWRLTPVARRLLDGPSGES